MSTSISKQELIFTAFNSHFLLKMALGRGADNVSVLEVPLNSPLFKRFITSSIELSSGFSTGDDDFLVDSYSSILNRKLTVECF